MFCAQRTFAGRVNARFTGPATLTICCCYPFIAKDPNPTTAIAIQLGGSLHHTYEARAQKILDLIERTCKIVSP